MLLYWFYEINSKHWTIATQINISFLNYSQFMNKINDLVTNLKHTLRPILKGLSLHTKPLERFTVSEKLWRDKGSRGPKICSLGCNSAPSCQA